MADLEKRILQYLDEIPDGMASPTELLIELGFGFTMNELDDVLRVMNFKGFLVLHPQMRSSGGSKYDIVRILEAGRKFFR